VALWGEKADVDVAPGDELAVADVEIQDGWQDDLEASAGWRASVTVLDDGNVTGPTGDDRPRSGAGAGASGSGAGSGRDSNSDSGQDATAALDSFSGSDADPGDTGGDAGGTGPDRDDGESVEFVGTVVQAGEPVVLDDGEETISVETDADLHLGQQVTVRGVLREGRLDADDVETT
ncbi:MAG: replication factor A1, partial [Natronomonas sp.]